MRKDLTNIFLITTAAIFLAMSCRKATFPKPRGFFRIALPVKEYTMFRGEESPARIPVNFEYPAYGKVSFIADEPGEPGWFNVEFPEYKARIYLTYKPVNNNLESLLEQAYRMNVKNHIVKADAIDESIIDNREGNIHGILYDLKGSTATSVQFFVTDSINHFLRGSLYFASDPDPDSLMPLTRFFREDILHLIETLKWVNK